MKTLFFAVNKKQKNFFNKILVTTSCKGKIIYSKKLIIPSLFALKDIKKIDLSAPINLKTNDFTAKFGFLLLSPIIKSFFTVLAYINYIRYYKHINQKYDQIMVWNGSLYRQAIALQLAKLHNIKILYSEIGLLPHRVTIDSKGVNFNNSVPREKKFFENYTNDNPLPKTVIPRQAKNSIKFLNIKKVNLPKDYIFIPFQVDYDTQILINSPWISNMDMLFDIIEKIAQENTKLNFVFKEHPSSIKDYPHLHTKAKNHLNIFFANNHLTQELIQNAKVVITINSTVGIESLLFNKKVVVLGNAFYAIEGITKIAKTKEELQNILIDINNWDFNKILVENFLKYLYYDYLIEIKDDNNLKKFFF